MLGYCLQQNAAKGFEINRCFLLIEPSVSGQCRCSFRRDKSVVRASPSWTTIAWLGYACPAEVIPRRGGNRVQLKFPVV